MGGGQGKAAALNTGDETAQRIKVERRRELVHKCPEIRDGGANII